MQTNSRILPDVTEARSEPNEVVTVPVKESTPHTESSSPSVPLSETITREYPSRIRQPPVRYDPSIPETYVIVCN